jgi:hypothetical protein
VIGSIGVIATHVDIVAALKSRHQGDDYHIWLQKNTMLIFAPYGFDEPNPARLVGVLGRAFPRLESPLISLNGADGKQSAAERNSKQR